jgi:hypothetical protein
MADWGLSDPDFKPAKSNTADITWGLSDPDAEEGVPLPPTRQEEEVSGKEPSFTGALVGEGAPETSIALGGAPVDRDPATEKSIGEQFYEGVPGAKMATRSLVGQKAGFWFDALDKQKYMQDQIAAGTYVAPIQQKEINDRAEQARQKLPELLAEYAQINADLEVEAASGERKTIKQLYQEGDYGTMLSQIGKEYVVEPIVSSAPQIAATIAGGPAAPLTGGAYAASDAYSNAVIEETVKRGGDPKNLENMVDVFEANRDEIMSTAGKKAAIGGGFGAILGAGPASGSAKQFFGNLLGFYAPVSTLQTAAMREETQMPVLNPQTGQPVVMPDGKVLMEDLPPMTLGETAETYAKGVAAGLPFGLANIRIPQKPAKPQAPEVPPTLPPFRGQGPETSPPSGQGPAGRATEAAPPAPAKPVDLKSAAVLKADGWSISEISMMSPRQQKVKADKAIKERNVKPAPLTPEEIAALSSEAEAPAAPSSPEASVEARGPEGVLPSSSAPPAAPPSRPPPTNKGSLTKRTINGVEEYFVDGRPTTLEEYMAASSARSSALAAEAPSQRAVDLVNQGVPPIEAMQRASAATRTAEPSVALAEPPSVKISGPITLDRIKPYLPTDAAGNPNYGALQQKIVEIAGPDKFLKDLTPEQEQQLISSLGGAAAPAAVEAPAPAKPVKFSVSEAKKNFDTASTGKPFKAKLIRGQGAAESPYNEMGVQEPILGEGLYTTHDEEYASSFGPNITEHQVALNNPLVIETDNQWRDLTKRAGWSRPNPIGADKQQTSKDIARLRQMLVNDGHDGVVVLVPPDERRGKTLQNVFGADQVIEFNVQKPAPVPAVEKSEPIVEAPKPEKKAKVEKPAKQPAAKAVEAPAQMESVKGNTYGSMAPKRFISMMGAFPSFGHDVKGKTPLEAGTGAIKVRVDPTLLKNGGKMEDAIAAIPAAVKEVIVGKDAYKGLKQNQVAELNNALAKIEAAGGKVTLEGEPPTFSKVKRSRPTRELGAYVASIGGIKGYNPKTGKLSQEYRRIGERRIPGLIRKNGGREDMWTLLQEVVDPYYPEWKGIINQTRRYDDDSQSEKIQTFLDDLEAGGVYPNGERRKGELRQASIEDQEDFYDEISANLRADLNAFGIKEYPEVFNVAVQILARGEVKDGYEAYELATLEVAMEDPSILEPVIYDITGDDYWSTVAEQRRDAEGEAIPAEPERMEADFAYETEQRPAPEAGAIRREDGKRKEEPAAKAAPEGAGKRVSEPVSGKAERESGPILKEVAAYYRNERQLRSVPMPDGSQKIMSKDGSVEIAIVPKGKDVERGMLEAIRDEAKAPFGDDPTKMTLDQFTIAYRMKLIPEFEITGEEFDKLLTKTPDGGLAVNIRALYDKIMQEKTDVQKPVSGKAKTGEITLVNKTIKDRGVDQRATLELSNGEKFEIVRYSATANANFGPWEYNYYGRKGEVDLGLGENNEIGKDLDDAIAKILEIRNKGPEKDTTGKMTAEEAQNILDDKLRPGYKVSLSAKGINIVEGSHLIIKMPGIKDPARVLNNKKELTDWIKGTIRVLPEEAKKPVEEKGADNKPQLVVPGAEKISDKELAERKAAAPMRAKVEQKEAGGLFGEGHLQNELKFMQQLKSEGKIVGYHGSTDIVERFLSEKTKLKRGIFFSKAPELANRFADRTAIGEDPLKYRGDFPDEEVIEFVEDVLGKNEADRAARLIQQYDAAVRHDDSLESIGVSWDSPEREALRKDYNAASRDLNKILMTASSMAEGKPNVTKVIINPGKIYNYSFEKEFDWAEEEAAIKFARSNGYDTVKFNLPNSRFGDDEFYSVLDEKNVEPFYSKRYSPPAIQVFPPQEQEVAKELYKEFEGIVRRTIGEGASVKFVKSIQTGMESKLAAGAYDRVSNAIYLATDLEKGASLEDAVYHEAWHVIEDLLSQKELDALDRYRAVTNKKVAQFYKVPVETIEALPKTEQDAYAMGMFGAMKDAGMKMGQGALPTPVYETLQKSYLTFLRFRNAVKKTVGMRDPDTIFTDFYLGNMRDRLMERTEDMAEALGFDQSVQYQKMRRKTPQGPQRWAVPKENFGAELMHNFVDRYYDWTRVQRAIEASKGAPLKEPLDVELSIQLMQDKAIAKQNKIWEEEAVALLAEMQANKITAKEFGNFLYAQHARERNARMFARDPSRFNGNNGSGMTNAEANQILTSLTPAKRNKMEKLYQNHIRKMIQADLDYRLDNDLLTQDQYDSLILPYNKGGYDYYVPLTGYAEDENDATNDIPDAGRGFAIWGKEYKVAFGRKSLALNPLFSVIQRRMDGIVRVEKNNTDMTVYRLLKENPNPEFASIYTPNNLPKRPVLKADGTVQYIPDFAEARSEYTLPLKIGGQPIYIVFNRDNESASRLVRQMKNLVGEQPGIAMRGVLAMGRFMSKVNTQWVPDFFLVNLPRDVQDALITIYSTREGFATNFLKEFGTAGNIIRKINMNQKLSPDEQTYYDEWTEHGGRMDFGGFSSLLKTQEKINDDFASIIQGPRTTAAQVNRYLKKTGDLTLGTIEKVNQVFDDTVRLAVYIAARRDPKNQFTPDRAAQLSRRATVDFRQRGDKMPFLNAMKPFLAVGITGARNLSRIARTKRGLRALFYMILLGVITSILGYALSEDDETDPTKKKYFTQVNSWERAKSIVLPIPINGKYVKIPLGFYGLVAFGLGDQLVGVATGNIKPMDAATNIGASLLASFVPFYSGDWVNSILPWVAAPLVQLGTNRNWLGNPIYPDQDTNMPQSSQAFERTPDWAKSAAELMNRLSNGSYTEPGWVDVYPATLSYFVEFFGGAARTFASNTYDSFRKLMDGEEFKAGDIPFARRFSTKDTADTSSFYSVRNEIKQSVAQARAVQKIIKDPKADPQKKADARETMKRLSKELGIRFTPDGVSTKYSVVEQFDKADDRIKVLNDLIKKTQDGDMTNDEKMSRIKDLEASKKKVMDAARKRYINRNPSPQSPLDAVEEMFQ